MLMLVEKMMKKIWLPGEAIRAQIEPEKVCKYMEVNYGFDVKAIQEMESNDDIVFRVMIDKEQQNDEYESESNSEFVYILKFTNAIDSRNLSVIEAQNEILVKLSEKYWICPKPIKQKNGEYYSIETIVNNDMKKQHVMRLYCYIPGPTLSEVPITKILLKNYGHYMAKLHDYLYLFKDHEVYQEHRTIWSLTEISALDVLKNILPKSQFDHVLIKEILDTFEESVLNENVPATYPDGLLHGNLSDDNVILTVSADKIRAVIDYDELHRGYLVFELAAVLADLLVRTGNIVLGKFVVQGYRMGRELKDAERGVLKLCMCCRLIQNLVLGDHMIRAEVDAVETRPVLESIVQERALKWYYVKTLWAIDTDNFLDLMGIRIK